MKNLLSRVPMLVWFLIVALVLVVGGVVVISKMDLTGQKVDPTKPEKVSKEVPGTELFSIVSREHIQSGTPGSNYNSDPPTSGPHWPAPANKGIYDKDLADEQAIHNLEHGYIWISYKPDAGDDVVNKLKGLVEKDNWKIVMAPRERDQNKIVLAAWGRVLKLDDYDEKRIKGFIATYRNRGPEKTPE